MSTIRGERFEINLDDDASNSELGAGSLPPMRIGNFVTDIQERQTSGAKPPQAPSMKSGSTGFPAHKKRTGQSRFKQEIGKVSNVPDSQPAAPNNLPPTMRSNSNPLYSPDVSPTASRKEFVSPEDIERHNIDQENNARLADMSADEIEQERQDLLANMNPALIQRLLQRSTIEDNTQPKWNTGFEINSRENVPPINTGAQRPPPHERKVSFAVPDETDAPDRARRPTAERHSISSSAADPSDATSPIETPRSPSKIKKRPSSDRKVSFAVADDEGPDLERKITAERHSISSDTARSPELQPDTESTEQSVLPPRRYSLNPIENNNSPYMQGLSSPRNMPDATRSPIEPITSIPEWGELLTEPEGQTQDEGSIHFPKPLQPDLDPSSPSFLDDLHKKYFPNLSHDPAKLAWLQPTSTASAENAVYANASSISPADIRFDFEGKIIPPSRSAKIATNLGLHNHGDQPGAAGYTIPELARLARSAFPAQRCLAMQTLGRVLFRLGKGEFGDENDAKKLPGAGTRINLDAENDEGQIIDEDDDELEPEQRVKVERGKLAAGLWDSMEQGRVTDTLVMESEKQRGHQTSIAVAQEAVWLWRRGGGRVRKAV